MLGDERSNQRRDNDARTESRQNRQRHLSLETPGL